MSAVTQASAQVAKTVAVTTGKVSNAKSMMIWRPHGNKYVETKRARERDEMKMKVGEGLAISREGVIIANARFVEVDVARGGDVMNNNIISHRSRGRGRETRADERARQRSFGWVIRG